MATDHPSTPDPARPPNEDTDDTTDTESTDLVPVPQPPDTDPTALPQPDPIEPRPYIEIRPSESPVDPVAVTRAMGLIDRLLRESTQTGIRHKLRGSTVLPVVEWLLVADGREDTSIRYLVGSNVSDLVEDLEGICRTAFPNSYEFEHVEWHPRYLEEYLPIVSISPNEDRPGPDSTNRDGPHHPSITPDSPYVAGVEYVGRARRKMDWQTPLQPFESFTQSTQTRTGTTGHPNRESRRVPLAALVESIRDADLPIVYQVVAHPYEDWTGLADAYISDLSEGTVSFGDRVWEFLSPRDREAKNRYNPPPADEERIEGIAARDPAHTLTLSARAVVLTRDAPSKADAIARRLANDLSHLSGRYHEIVGKVATDDEWYSGNGSTPGTKLYDDVCGRAVYHAVYYQLGDWLRRRPHESQGLVVDVTELPGFCILDGAGLTPNGRRAIATRPAEQTGLPLPPPEQLARYQVRGMPLCRPLTHDRLDAGTFLSIPPSLQTQHLVVGGATGSGKSVNLTASMLGNAYVTDGPNVLFDLKGDGMAEEYLKAHYLAFGSLEDIYYFDLTETLPALSFFDIRGLLEAGVPRAEATARIAGHYEEIVKGVMGSSRFEQAVVSPQVIATHIEALFDPIHGDDVFAHRDLQEALVRTQTQKSGPPVSDDDLETHFASLVEDDPRMFAQVMAGARVRIERIGLDRRLAPAFNHVPDDDDPAFDFADILDDDATVIFDFGGMEDAAKRTLTLVLLSALWSALKARAQQRDGEQRDDHPVVNVYLDEAAAVADTKLVDTLLSQGRSFGLSVTMGLQFLGQLRAADTNTYYEVLNETATFLVGSVAVDHDLASALATEDMPPAEVENRLRALRAGEWLVRLGAEFAEATPRPFLAHSLTAPPGHSASDQPLAGNELTEFRADFAACRDRIATAHGLAQRGPTAAAHADADADGDGADSADPDDDPEHPPRLDSLLPYTQRLPDCIDYDQPRHAIVCAACENRFNPTPEGMRYAIECCHSLDDVDRDDVPPTSNNLKRSIEEIRDSEWSVRQHLLIQSIYNAQQCAYHPLEYDIVYDSMLRLQEYVGIDAEEVQALLDAGVIRHDTDHPHRLYSVAPEARSMIGEAYRRGVEYGHGKGDLEESAEHVFGMEVAKRWAQQVYVEDPDHPGVELSPYHELDPPTDESDQRRLDLAVLDADGNVVVAIEVERINHDYREAVPRDYDKMAACEPKEAVWIVMKQADGHKVLSALNDPPDGEPRVEKTYATTTPPQQFRLDEPGCTDILPAEYLRDNVLEPPEWYDQT